MTLVVAATITLTATTSNAAELFYTWKKGSTHRFAAKSKDSMNMSTMGMKVAQRTTTESNFTLKIDRVRANGTAEGTLYIESFTVRDDSGRVLGNIQGLPPSSLKSLVTVDRKGRFTFQEHVYLIVEDGRNLVATGRVGPNGAMASANDGEEEVTVWATIDPSTGRLSGGASVKKVAKKKKRRVKVRRDKPRVDLVPRMFMELLRLPDGAVSDGAVQVAMNHPNLSNDTRVTAQILDPAPTKTRVKTTFETRAASSVPTSAPADAEDDGATAMGGGMPDLGGMPGMGDMDLSGLPGMGAGGGGATVDTKMRVDGWATIVMNRRAGTLQSLKGRITGKTSMGGMAKIDTDSELELTRR